MCRYPAFGRRSDEFDLFEIFQRVRDFQSDSGSAREHQGSIDFIFWCLCCDCVIDGCGEDEEDEDENVLHFHLFF